MRETLNTAAFKCENDMRAICGMGARQAYIDPSLQPKIPDWAQAPPPPPPGSTPAQGSFELISFSDLKFICNKIKSFFTNNKNQ